MAGSGRVAGAVAGAAGLVLGLGRRWQLGWGSARLERTEPLAGDDLIDHPHLSATRAIDITARPEEVWPWLAQLGQAKGGFYSYQALENLAGCHIHNADRVHPEWQGVQLGDGVNLAPKVALSVAQLRPGRALVLRGGVPAGPVAPPFDFTWAFVLRPRDDGSTRLLVRERYRYLRPWAGLLVEPVEAISFLMTQRMLRGIKSRAEGVAK